MWHVLRAELAYFRPFLLIALAIASGVAVMLTVLMLLGADDGSPPKFVAAALPAIFPIIASMVVGFIAQGTRSEERRARLLLAGPLTPRQLAGVMILLPTCLVALGALASGLLIGVASLVTGEFELATLRIVGANGGMMFVIAQMGPLAQEATAARRQRRLRAAIAGWAGFVVAILLLAAFQWYLKSIHGHLGQLIVAVMAMVVSAALYAGRTDFTR